MMDFAMQRHLQKDSYLLRQMHLGFVMQKETASYLRMHLDFGMQTHWQTDWLMQTDW